MMNVRSHMSLMSRMARLLAITGVLTITSPLSGLARSPQIDELAASPPAAVVAGHGVQLSDMDLSVDPGQDFYRYATGAWQDGNEIPPDEAWWGVYDQTNDLTRNQLIDVLAQYAASDTLPVGPDEWKAVQLFAQARDMDTRNAQGLDPIAGDLAQIDEIASLDDLYAFLREAPLTTHVWCGLSCLWVGPDYADSSVYAAWYSSPYLGLPSRDYYWEDDESNEPIREAYRAMSAKLLGVAGYDPARATTAAANVYAFEKRLAEPMFRIEEWNDPQNYYHPQPVAALSKADPAFDWPAFLSEMGIPDIETIIVPEEEYLAQVDGIVATTDLETVKDYLKLQVLRDTAESLTAETEQISFDFYRGVLRGVEQQRPLDERVIGYVNDALGFALGKLYVQAYVSPETKALVEEMVAQERDAARARIAALTWMAPETREAAIAKLDAMQVKVAYPDAWRSYEGVNIEESLPASLLSASVAETRRWLARIGQPVDREEWLDLPQTVNAYYNPSNNEFVVMAGFLQPPFFDPEADLASNYGALGAIIGHEITHGFDQSGSQFDARGNLADWWTPEDASTFESLTGDVVAQFDAIEVLPGLFIDGELTIGENIADMGGMQIAYDGLQLALADAGDPGLIDGLTPDQRFFISAAFSSASEVRDEALRMQVETDFHAPDAVRGVQPSRNMDAFYEAFDIGPDDPMYLPPAERIVIW